MNSRSKIGALSLLVLTCPLSAIAGVAVGVSSSKTDSFTPNGAGKVEPGGTIRYTTTVTNNGSGTATGVELADPVPAGTTLVPGSVNVSPLARDDAFTTVVNTQLSAGGGTPLGGPLVTSSVKLTDNDSEFLGDSFGISTYSGTSTQGGAVAVVTSGPGMGAFVYQPPVGFVGSDSFTYTLRDDGVDGIAGNSDDLTGVGTVFITVTEANTTQSGTQKIWYLDNTYAGANGAENGTSARPFNALSDLSGVSGPDADTDVLYVRAGSGDYTGGITLRTGQSLIGENEPLVINGITLAPAGVDPVIANAAGAGVSLAAGNTLRGFTVGNTTTGDIAGSAVGVLTVSNVICNGTGPVMAVTTSGTLDVVLDGASTTSSTGAGIQLVSCTGSFSAAAGSLAGCAGSEIDLNGGTVTFNYPGTVTSTAGGSISIASRTGGTVSLSGAISISGGTGVALSSNAGSTINLSGGITASTAANGAFSATGGGTVTVTGAANTLTTTTGTALRVSGTTIGASGITFRSISSNGAANGIVLSSTGSSGGFSVTGNGSAGTGGTIQNCTADGISIANAAQVRLSWMNLTNNLGNGILGSTVNGLLMDRMSITGNGNDAGADESGVLLSELTGTAFAGTHPTGITNSTISNNNEFEVQITNSAGTLNDFRLTSNTISSNGLPINGNATSPHGNLVNFLATGSATMTLTATNGSFTGNWNPLSPPATFTATGLHIDHSGASGTMTASVTNAVFSNNNSAVNVSAANGGSLVFDVNGCTASGNRSHGLNHFLAANSTGTTLGKFRNNAVGTAGVTGSASQIGIGIRVQNEGAANDTLLIDGNTIQETAALTSFQAINVNVGITGSATYGGTTNLTITNNSISNILNSRAIVIQDNQGTGPAYPTVFANISGNTFSGTIAGQAGDGTYMRLRELNGTLKVTQAAATAGVIASELDNANGFADPTKISISGTPVFSAGTPPQPLIFAASLPEPEVSPVPTVVQVDGPAVAQAMAPATAEAAACPPVDVASALTEESLDGLIAEAKRRWIASGITPEQSQALESLRFEICDLGAIHLGQAGGDRIQISRTAAGNPWFVDPSPADDVEFGRGVAATRRVAEDGSVAHGRVDLLSTVIHEMGHRLGLPDCYDLQHRDAVMFGFLTKGERRMPARGEAAGAKPLADEVNRFLGAPIALGDLPPGKTLTIVGAVTVNDPPTTQLVSSQGVISGSNFANVLTDDPDVAGVANPTTTPVERPDAAVNTLARVGNSPSNAASVTWRITFSQPVSNLVAGNFALVSGGLAGSPGITGVSPVTSEPSASWDITATTGSGSGTLGLNLANDGGTLSHDVTNQPFTGEVFVIDRLAPVFSSINRFNPSQSETNADTLVFRATFSEDVTQVGAADFTVSGTTATVAAVTGSGSTYDVTVNGGNLANANGPVALGLAAAQDITDLAGNPLPGTAPATVESYTLDNVAPSVVLASVTSNPMVNAVIPVTVTFSESVTGFDSGDLTISGATLSNFAGSGAIYTFDLTPSGPGVTVTADVNSDVAQDAAGNGNFSATQFTRTIVDEVAVVATTATAVEGGATGLYTFTRGSSSGPLTVGFQLDGSSTAVAGTDFTLASSGALTFDQATGVGTIVIPDTQLSATVSLTALTESTNPSEAAETARLNVVAASGYLAGTPADATVTILANSFLVTTTADSGTGSLRQAALNANAIAGVDTIVFDSTVFETQQKITLTSGEVGFTEAFIMDGDLDDDGVAEVVISGNQASRVLSVAAGVASADLTGLILEDGNTSGGGGGLFIGIGAGATVRDSIIRNHVESGLGGGGIYGSGASLTLINCAIIGNTSSFFGGGVRLVGSNSLLRMIGTTVSGNSTTGAGAHGGGVQVANTPASAWIVNCTFSGNSALGSGALGGGLRVTSGGAVIHNSTFVGNAAAGGAGGVSANGSETITNTVVAGNTAGAGATAAAGGSPLATGGVADDVGGVVESATNCYFGSSVVVTTDSGSLNNQGTASLLLGNLADNGGVAFTHALLTGSALLNAGSNAVLPADILDLDGDADTAEAIPFDQRGLGFSRAIGTVDIGAFELQKSVSIAALDATKVEGNSGSNGFTFTISRSGDTTGDVTVTYTVGGAGVDGTDFVGGSLPTGTATITSGNASTTLSIPVSGDTTREGNEAFTVTLSNPNNGYVLAGSPAAGSITNDDFEADLAMTVTDGAISEVPGTGVTYTVTATNSGPDPVTGATVVNNLPAALSGVTWTAVGAGGGTVAASGSGNINENVNLPVGASVTFTVSGTISASATGSLANTATIAVPLGVTDPVPANNSATDTDTLTPEANLAITKTDGVTTVVPGTSTTYTIVVSNAGPSRATGVQVADVFPAGISGSWTAVGAGGGVSSGSSGTGNLSDTVDLPVGGTVTYTVNAAISAGATGTLSNTATVTAAVGTTDVDLANNSATDSNTLTPRADLAITKTDGATTATPGGAVTYTITASNQGPSHAPNATVADLLPASLTGTWTAVVAGGASAAPSGSGNLNETVNLPVGGSVTYTVTASISPGATGSLVNTATVSVPGGIIDPSLANNSATDTDTLVPRADLAITKTDGAVTAIPGNPVNYTITVTNAGPSAVTSATVADILPATIAGASWTAVGAGGGTVAASGSGNINENVNLPVGGSVTFTVGGTISASATGVLVNTATVAVPLGVTDPVLANNSATDSNMLTPEANLAITKTDGVTTVVPGNSTTYTIVVSNAGPSRATAVQVADVFPASISGSWTAVGAGGGVSSGSSGTGNINDTVDLPVGGTVTYTVNAAISAGATGTLSNTATVTAPFDTTDVDLANNSATDSNTLTPRADLAITKTDGATTATPGGSVTYTITASNQGPSHAPNATVADILPASLTGTWTAVAAGGASAAPSGSGNLNETVNLPVGGSVTYTVTASISPGATGNLANTATVSVPGGITDPSLANNSATDTDTLVPRADLAITKTDGATTATPGGSVTYTITASNQGPSHAPNATVADILPASLTGTWTAVAAGGASAAPSGSGNLNETVNLPVGGSVTYTVTASISPGATGSLANTATVSVPGGITDPSLANNSATDTDTLVPRADLAITKTDGVTSAIPGNPVTYTIRVTNAGPSAVTSATVADTLPATIVGASWTAVAAGGASGSPSGSGNINQVVSLPVGGSVTYTVLAPISPSATGELTNTASVSSAADDPVPANNSASDTDTLTPRADLSITKTNGVASSVPGTTTQYTIVVSNAGPSSVTGATVADTLPASIAGASWTAVGAAGGNGPASGTGNINTSGVNLPVGGSVTFTVNAPISAGATGNLVNTATVAVPVGVIDPSPANNSATDSDTLTPRADLVVTKTDGATTATPGGSTTYTIVVSNAGPSHATGVSLNDTLPAAIVGATWTGSGAGGGTGPASGAGDVATSQVNLPAGGSYTVTITAPISPSATGTLVNTATAATPLGVTDPSPANNSATDSDTLVPQADLAVVMQDSPDPVNALGNLTFEIDLTNHGPSDSAAPQVSLPLPSSTTFVSASAPNGWGTTSPAVGAGGTVVFNRASLAVAGTAKFVVVAKVKLDVVNNSTINATATASESTNDPVSNNNSAATATLARSGADLVATLTAAPDPVVAGTDLTYNLRVRNFGPLDAETAKLTFELPAGTTFVSLGGNPGWSATTPAVGGAGTVTIESPLFAVDGDLSFPLVVRVAPSVSSGTVIHGSLAVSSTTIDVGPGNEVSGVDSQVVIQSDLKVSLVANPEIAPKGSQVTYTVHVENDGPSDAAAPLVGMPVPANMTFVSATAPAGWSPSTPAVDGTGQVTFGASSLAAGADATFTVVTKVVSSTPTGTVVVGTATVSSSGTDPDPVDNLASDSVAVGTVDPTAQQPVTTGITVDRQTGLYQVKVRVTNTTPLAINGFRLHVDYSAYKAAYPSLRLYNATSPVGANDVYVDYPFPVAIDATVELNLAFYTSSRSFPSPFAPLYRVVALPSSQLPDTNGSGVQPRLERLDDGSVLLEFPSVEGRWYRVRYSSDLVHWQDCPVPIQATTNRMQWIDDGAPFTDIPPQMAPCRFYRVNEINDR